MNASDTAALHDELRSLARSRGLRAANLGARVGPSLRRHAGLGESVGIELRTRLVAWLRDRIAVLPADLRIVVAFALALDPRADQRLLTDRLGWLAVELDRDPRTVRRRCEEAFRLLAETAAAVDPDVPAGRSRSVGLAPAPPALAGPPAGAWYVERVWAVLRLDGPTPELLETRRVVALEDGLRELALSMSLPRPPGAPASPRDLDVDVLFGGRMVRIDRQGDTHYSPVLRLPRALGRHERHDFGCAWRVPAGQPMAPRYALNPTIRCDALDLRVRFPEDADPKVELVDGLPLRAVEDLAIDLPAVALDGVSEAFARFSGLASGLCYGLRWS
ncbi:hypothetical protein [Pseudofrankia inefficax]|uniref:Uncharacterized protein n=1 Tax=Pseudofrankia inefficax (strain DSM 45817 / CECT 9037 / DDB 130130 / EuI1c) TaxID=298654 RepID=E3J1W2_PSEI1|nr:hypothetical protein [Pseudofrankia inefficax]ADP82920.1 hypothetical protein FraEuI1c_4930 [Pseudofrankia inefficax]